MTYVESSYSARWPVFQSENDCKHVSRQALSRLCEFVDDEYRLKDCRMRIDLRGVLVNGCWALVECKKFSAYNLAAFIDAADQARSYADAIEYPVFIGPVYGKPSELSKGEHSNGLGAIHLMAGRWNVGFLYIDPYWGSVGLMLRGQNLVSRRVDEDAPRFHSRCKELWRFSRRVGSKKK